MKDAGIPEVTRHEKRRTGITRPVLNNMPPVAVQRMAGHVNLETMMKYYVQVNRQSLRVAVTRAFSIIVYRYFEAITRKKASFDRYTKIELALDAERQRQYDFATVLQPSGKL